MNMAARSMYAPMPLLRLAVDSTREVETGRLYVQGQHQLQSKTLTEKHN